MNIKKAEDKKLESTGFHYKCGINSLVSQRQKPKIALSYKWDIGASENAGDAFYSSDYFPIYKKGLSSVSYVI